MHRLVLLRHGKSDWNADFDDDHDRPLAERGRTAADRMGRLLAEGGEAPDLVLTSSAERARTTAERAADAGGWGCPVTVTEALYMASVTGVVSEIHRVSADVGRLMLVGHEPTWSTLASMLTGGSHIQVKTATAVGIDFDTIDSWRGVQAGRGTLAYLLPPRLFTG